MKILPVIHVESFEQADENTEIAFANGADGVWLINHSMSGSELGLIATDTKVKHKKWVGVNFLDMLHEDALDECVAAGLDALWADNYWPDENTAEEMKNKLAKIKESGTDVQYFGGVNFKYQSPRFSNLKEDAIAAMEYVDVITTSGRGTGESPTTHKIKTMKEAIGDFPLAIASGVDPENILSFADYVDYVLVATGVSKSFTEIDPEKLKKLTALAALHKGIKEIKKSNSIKTMPNLNLKPNPNVYYDGVSMPPRTDIFLDGASLYRDDLGD